MGRKIAKMDSGGMPVKEPRPLNILILDDDKSIVMMMESILRRSNKDCHISIARHGSVAFDLINNDQFDIAFIDIWLPDMNGLDVVARIKELNPETDCFVISSQNDKSYINKARMLGVEQYILKPLRNEQIRNIMDSAVTH